MVLTVRVATTTFLLMMLPVAVVGPVRAQETATGVPMDRPIMSNDSTMQPAPQSQPETTTQTPRSSTGLIPLTDLKTGRYKDQEGGLYGQGSNEPPVALQNAAQRELAQVQPLNAEGQPAADGKIGFISLGMSNTRMAFTTFMEMTEKDTEKNPQVVMVNCAQGSMGSPAWLDPERRRSDTQLNTWEYTHKAVQEAGLSPLQVQVAWMKQVRPNPHQWGDFPDHARQLQDQLAQIVVLARQHFPNLRVLYLSSRTYAGYASRPLSPEPYAYESAFSMRWLIQEQMDGAARKDGAARLNFDPEQGKVSAPLLLWGPYLWADGVKGRQIDDLVYESRDFTEKDGTHPTESGQAKVAQVMLEYFKTNPLAKSWFVQPARATRHLGPVDPFRMIGDVYYVGDGHVSSHLITSPQGHILIDAGMPTDGPMILKSIAELGFDAKDIKYILVTHSHLDHLGSAKYLREQTGAKIALHDADAAAAEKPDRTKLGLADFEPFRADVLLNEGDVIAVGDKQVHVYHTPGHTPGCLTFGFTVREDGQDYQCAIFGGPGTNVFNPRNLERNIYGGTMADFFKSLDRLAAMKVDVWLGPHPNLNHTFEKHQRLLQGEKPNPYIDAAGWQQFVAERRQSAQKYIQPSP